ncbi:MAG: signal peptidase I [Eubacterium sp.]|nr:signal peptidase I [Eubacterium sp.]
MKKQKKVSDSKLKKKYNGHLDSLLLFLEGAFLVVVAAVMLFQLVLGIAVVSGNSMKPTYKDGQSVLFIRIDKSYDRGDVIAIKMPTGDRYIKRIIGLPGDTIELKDGKVYVNGTHFTTGEESGITEPEAETVTYPLTLGESEYFVMGDNRTDSIDSRTFGPIVGVQIMGVIPEAK